MCSCGLEKLGTPMGSIYVDSSFLLVHKNAVSLSNTPALSKM